MSGSPVTYSRRPYLSLPIFGINVAQATQIQIRIRSAYWMRSLFWVSGIIVALGALSAVHFPAVADSQFPLAVDSADKRSLCGWIMILGVILIAMARENRPGRRPPGNSVPDPAFCQPCFCKCRASLSRSIGQTRLWVGLAFVTLICVCGLYLAKGSWRESMELT
jgi:hypothetical protein